ncbi:potassium channel family protein [Bacillus atrophaeus]|uniref:potassium channel family protein n=1 Tax=Bacillus atrophaeus TaxID=1452 RepID=UPI002280F1FE|nr:TrkA family potassium uptake protein [Bacillus atrophaeus]MCY8463448.1 TrkA family potassium uptake protein [Bacillus atrophaeus]MCY8477275.1 TrkA family potassium uptake protein [Bacillus atrophaeus]MCY8961164.1 TrkA family potassium uptake protein [Bacillus atrophaeus]MCY8962854.1 TrkA family potassium uptake protein [Bacillus atrophaeus]MCY9438341.1 TrkA family potassium uptake protein [Bacillus atrophaeus]
MGKKKKQFAIIGLGRFGGSICKELYEMGHEVLAIDMNEDKVKAYAPYSTQTIHANAAEDNVLKALGLRNFEYVIVAIGADIQTSILTTLFLKEMNIKNVWVKAQNHYHHKVLEKVGADRIIHPEKDMGVRVAQRLADEKILDYIELSEDYSVVELRATRKLHDKTILELDDRAKYGCTILAVNKEGKVEVAPNPETRIEENNCFVVLGRKRDIQRFEDEGM